MPRCRRGVAAPKQIRALVDEHGDCLFRYALVRVRRREVAEDLVARHITRGDTQP